MDASLISIALGVGLSAACGFRVFVPFLLMSGASMLGYLELSEQFAWIGTDRALIGFAVATGVEVIAYYVPWLDNMLDAIASPAAVGAGAMASASVLGDLPPAWQWGLSVIAGGGTAGLVQGGTVVTRGASSAGTGGGQFHRINWGARGGHSRDAACHYRAAVGTRSGRGSRDCRRALVDPPAPVAIIAASPAGDE